MRAASLRTGALDGAIVVAALLLLGWLQWVGHSPFYIAFVHPLTLAVGFLAAVALAVMPWTARMGRGVQLTLTFAAASIPLVLALAVIYLN